MNKLAGQLSNSTVIRGAHVVDPANKLDEVLDVAIQDGKVVTWGKNLKRPGATEVKAKGLFLLPGLIDLHVHFRDPGHERKETIETGIQAAIAGGFVACVSMPNTKPACDNAQIVKYQIERGALNGFNILPAGSLSQGRGGEKVSDMAEMKAAGAVAVTDDGDWLHNSSVARRAYEYAATHDLLVMTHAEDPDLSLNGVINEGVVSTQLGLRGKPNTSEDVATARDVELARLTGCRLHVRHLRPGGRAVVTANTPDTHRRVAQNVGNVYSYGVVVLAQQVGDRQPIGRHGRIAIEAGVQPDVAVQLFLALERGVGYAVDADKLGSDPLAHLWVVMRLSQNGQSGM